MSNKTVCILLNSLGMQFILMLTIDNFNTFDETKSGEGITLCTFM